jgi:hypothetical protein
MGRDDTSRPATRRIGQLSDERDVTGVVESMKPRCRFRRREVAARETGAVFCARLSKGGDRPRDGFRDRLRFAPARWNDRVDRSSEMTTSQTSETSHDVRSLVIDGDKRTQGANRISIAIDPQWKSARGRRPSF